MPMHRGKLRVTTGSTLSFLWFTDVTEMGIDEILMNAETELSSKIRGAFRNTGFPCIAQGQHKSIISQL